jgi:hypothetical protein
MIKELQNAQEKLKIINSLSNALQKIDDKEIKNDIAYFIHEIVDDITGDVSTDTYRKVASYQILSNKDLFVTVK